MRKLLWLWLASGVACSMMAVARPIALRDSAKWNLRQLAPFLAPGEVSAAQVDELERFCQGMARERAKLPNHEQFLRQLHRKTFARFLRHYTEQSSLNEVLAHGRYDCLSGALVFALALEQCGFAYTIHETNVHVYVRLHTPDGQQWLIEPTDAQHGLVKGEEAIAQRLARYRQINTPEQANVLYNSRFNIERTVSLPQMAGLLHYNRAVKLYLGGLWAEAVAALQKADEHGERERNAELMLLCLDQLLQCDKISPAQRNTLAKMRGLYSQKLAHAANTP